MDRQLLDPIVVSELKELSAGKEPSFFLDQVLLFSRRGRNLLVDLEEAMASEDFKKLATTAHALAGSAAVIGASRLSALCQSLEDHVSSWNDLRLKRVVQEVHMDFKETELLLASEASDVCIVVERLDR